MKRIFMNLMLSTFVVGKVTLLSASEGLRLDDTELRQQFYTFCHAYHHDIRGYMGLGKDEQIQHLRNEEKKLKEVISEIEKDMTKTSSLAQRGLLFLMKGTANQCLSEDIYYKLDLIHKSFTDQDEKSKQLAKATCYNDLESAKNLFDFLLKEDMLKKIEKEAISSTFILFARAKTLKHLAYGTNSLKKKLKYVNQLYEDAVNFSSKTIVDESGTSRNIALESGNLFKSLGYLNQGIKTALELEILSPQTVIDSIDHYRQEVQLRLEK